MPATLDLRRGQVTGDASRRFVTTDVGGAIAAAPNKPITLTGDVTGTGTAAIATTLATVNASPGAYNNLTVNGKGLATAGSNVAYLTANQTITLSGDVTGSGTTAVTCTLPAVNANVGTFQGITVNAKGLVTAAANQSYLTTATATSTYLPLAGGAITGSAPGNLVIGTPPGATLGAGTLNMTGALQVNANAVLPALGLGEYIRVYGPDSASPSIGFSSYAGAAVGNAPAVNIYKHRGTGASPAATLSGDNLGNLNWNGYTGSANVGIATIQAVTTENTGVSWGGAINFFTTANGGTALAQRLQIAATGGMVVGAPTGGDKGPATINATSVYAAGVLLTSDAELKHDIAPLPSCLGIIEAIEPKRFRLKDPGPAPSGDPDIGPTPSGPPGWFDRTRWGFIAQDVEAAMTGHDFGGVEAGADGMRSLSYFDLLAVLWQAVRELQEAMRRIETLEAGR